MINRLLENLPSHFEEFGSKWFSLTHHMTDRRFKEIGIYGTLDPQESAEM
ncbi:Uncharacterised protein [Mycolicibacterium flavescens]|nr:Uncharacterised protein [Mycolicibacterium flavescens]